MSCFPSSAPSADPAYRCAVGIYPSQQLLDWAKGLDLDVDASWACQPCLYLIPDYETEEEARTWWGWSTAPEWGRDARQLARRLAPCS